jgi:molybdate transport system substrate-binding protein
MNHLLRLLFIGFALLSTSCTNREVAGSRQQEIIVFAAASLTNAFSELATAFEARHPETAVLLNFAGSSQLTTQLAEGMPAELFASANMAQMDVAIQTGRIAAAAPIIFASNRLVILVPADNPAQIQQLSDLARPGVLLITAVPGVPIRQYSDQLIAGQGDPVATQITSNIVSEADNVRQIVAKIALGEADAALVYQSDVTPDIASNVLTIPLPEAQNIVAHYPLALVDDANRDGADETARQFINFVLSAEGQQILSKWGFGSP